MQGKFENKQVWAVFAKAYCFRIFPKQLKVSESFTGHLNDCVV